MGRWEKLKQSLQFVAGAVIVVCAYWNILAFDSSVRSLPPRESDEMVIQEKRFQPIRQILNWNGYTNGAVAFITDPDLKIPPPSADEEKRWAQAQYAMIPWVLVRDRRPTPFLVADFWRGMPSNAPDSLVKLYDSGNGLILFQRKQLP